MEKPVLFQSKNILCILVFISSLLLIFEVEIRSIGHLEIDPVEPIELLSISGLRISHFGFLLPIFFVTFIGKFTSKFLKDNLLLFLIFSIAYGFLIFFIRNNSSFSLMADFRVCFGLFTGLSLGALLPNTRKAIATTLTLTSAVANCVAIIILFALPGEDFTLPFVRTTHPSAFILSYLSMAFTAPSMIFSILLRNRKLIAISWLNAAILLITCILITQTRSQAIAIALGIFFAMITTSLLLLYFDQSSKKMRLLKTASKVIIVFLIFIMTSLYVWKDNFEPFLLRMQSAFEPQMDGGIAPRLEEVPAVFETMDLLDHITGMGFSPDSILSDWRGNPHNVTHIGVLNVWWRLGSPFFLSVVYLFAKLMINWFKSLKFFYLRSLLDKVDDETLATIICAPGVITLFSISCMSGGWAREIMISLGILWGVYRKLTGAYAMKYRSLSTIRSTLMTSF